MTTNGFKSKTPVWQRLLAYLLSAALLLGQPTGVALANEPDAGQTQAATQTEPSQTEPSQPVSTAPAPADTPPATTEPAPEQPSQPGPTGPTGPTTTPGPSGPTGPTENPEKIPNYAYDDATRKWVPAVRSSFTWNQSLGRYESPLYSYDNRVGWYHVIPGAVLSGGSSSPSPVTALSSGGMGAGGTSSGINGGAAATLAALLGLDSGLSNSNTGPGSSNTIGSSSSSDLLLRALSNALVNNTSNSTAATGDASVAGNTIGGNATTGPATVIENLLNLLNAAWSWTNGGLTTFAENILGDYFGDITLNPQSANGGGGQLGSYAPGTTSASNSNTGPDSTNQIDSSTNGDITVVNRPQGTINNDLNLLAQSGDASVTGNTQAGNATSGAANVEVNILNLINSAINAGESFFGLLNVFGNLNGDILFPDGFLDSVAGTPTTTSNGNTTVTNNNTGPGSTNDISSSGNLNANVTNSPSAAFSNNINTAAQSGNALVDSNTRAGNATTGSAETSNNLFNLFNTGVAGDNAVLVLVNVMGQWVGHIMNLPDTGNSTGALLTGNASLSNTNTGPGSNNSIDSNQSGSINVENSPSGTINNNINAGAISGNATVASNTNAGNATSGNASVSTNVANIFGSQFNLKKWFGVLVVNVFGNWTGSVADDTAAGEASGGQSSTAAAGQSSSRVSTASISNQSETVGVSRSVDQNSSGDGVDVSASVRTQNDVVTTSKNDGQNALVASAKQSKQEAKSAAQMTSWMLILAAIALALAGASMTVRRRLV